MAFLGALSPRAPPGVEQMADADRGQFAADTLGEKSAAPAADADDRSARLSELRDVVSQAVMRQVVRLLNPILTL